MKTQAFTNAGGKFLSLRFSTLRPGILLLAGFLGLGVAAPAHADLAASVTLVSGDPSSIYPGEQTRLRITLSNNNTGSMIMGAAFGNSLPGVLPNGLSVAGAYAYTCFDPATSLTSPGSGTLTAASGTQALSLALGVIPARANNTDGSCTIDIPVTAGTSTGNTATYPYTIASGAVTGNDGVARANVGAVSQSINVRALARPTISKNFVSSTLSLGGAATTLSITLTNSNSVPIPNFSLADAFPQLGGSAIIQVASTPGATASCNNGGAAPAFAPAAGDTSLSASGTIPARVGGTNGSCTFTVQVEGRQTNGAYSTGAQTNTINASSNFANDIGIPAAANATAPITVTSPLGVAKAFAHATLSSGNADSFTLTLSNSGTTPLTVTSFDDDPIDGHVGTGYGLVATGGTTTCAGGAVSVISAGDGIRLSGGTIPAGGSCTVTGNFTGTTQIAGVPISYTNSIPQGAVDVGNAAIVSQSRTASILVADDLRLLKTATPAHAAPGNPVRYALTVQNFGAAPISNLVITDNLSVPNGLTYLTGTINGIDYTPALSGAGCAGLSVPEATGATTVHFTLGTLPARSGINAPGSCTITFYAMVPAGAANGTSTANIINAGDACYGGPPAICNGGGATSSGTDVGTPVLTLVKQFDGQNARTYPEGTVSTLRITLTSNSANPLSNVSVSDTLPLDSTPGPGQLRIANPANAATSCGGSPTLTATPGTTSITLNNASVPARANHGTGAAGSCFLQVDVVGPAGVYPNTATTSGTETYANGLTHAVGPATSNTATLTYTSALTASKSFNPSPASTGSRSTLTIHLANSSAAALSNVSVSDPLPAGMLVATPANAYTTCAGGTSVTAVAAANTASMSGADIAAFGSCDFVFDVMATGNASWVNIIPAGNITANGGISNVTPVTGTLAYQAPTSLALAKATNPATLTFPGQLSQLTLTITNGTQAVSGLHVTDYFTTDGTAGAATNGMVVAVTPAASTTCPGGIVTAAVGGNSVSVSGVSLAASASCTVSVNVTSTSVGGITNFIPVGAIVTHQGLSNSGQASTSLTTQSNLGITKQFTPNVVKPGERSRLRITFYNPTALPVTALAVLDTLPAGVTVPAGPNPATTCSGATVSSPAANQVQVSGGVVPAAAAGVAATCHAEIDVVVAAQGDYLNTLSTGAVTGTSGGSPVTNSQPTSDTLRAKSPLTIHKAITNRTLDAGNPAGFTTGTDTTTPGTARVLTIRLTNPNAVALTQAGLTDTLPAGLVIAGTPSASTTCAGGTVFATPAGTSVRLAGGTIPANGSCDVLVNVLSNISGTYTNTIPAGGASTFEGVSNDEPTRAQLIVSRPPSVAKQFSPPVIPANGISTLTIFLGNDNASALTLTAPFVDTLPVAPGNIVVAPAPNVSKTCPGAVTAAAGSGTLTYASGASIPVGGCSISVDVTGATTGVHTNTIAAGALQTNLGNNPAPANTTLTISPLGFVSGKVFRDNNVTPNGTFDSGTDTPLSAVGIELRSGANCAGALVASTATDVLGNYLFAGLAAGTYSVCEPVQPAGTVNGMTTAGTISPNNGSTGTAGSASNPSATTSQIAGIVLNGNGAAGEVSGSANNHFAEVALSSISGTVFLDQNNNGAQNGGDTGIAAVTLELLDASNTVVATTTTDAGGNYTFSGLVPGTYSVREPTQPPSTSNGITTPGVVPNGGTAGTATAVAVAPSRISNIVLPPNTASTGNNFAEIPNGRTLSGTVFLDFNNNGALNGPDHGIGSQVLNLTGTDINGNAVSRTTTTAPDGSYSFTGLPEGTYTVAQPSQPVGTTNGQTIAGSTGGVATAPGVAPSQITGISLTGINTVSANNNFAELPGAAPDLAIAKTHAPANFAAGGTTGYYTLTPSNVSPTTPTTGAITIVDTVPAGMTPTAASGAGWSCVIAGQTVTCTSSNVMAASATGNPLIVHVSVANGLSGQVLINTAVISGGGEPSGFEGNNTASDPTPIANSASLSGHVWRDFDHDRVMGAGEPRVPGWGVELRLNGVMVAAATTDNNGAYAFTGLAPGSGYQVLFREPASGTLYGYAVPNESGAAFTNGVSGASNPAGASTNDGTLKGLTLLPGDNIVEQSLPLDPSGVVYDAVTRNPLAGAVVTLTGPAGFNPAVHLVGGNATQATGPDGFYQFLLFNTAPPGVYTLAVTTYPAGYSPSPSTLIPACATTPLVGAVPNPALIQNSNIAPPTGVAAHNPAACAGIVPGGSATTQYFFTFNINPAGGSANIINNHIALDPILGGAIVMTKTTPLINVTRGDLVPYTITATNTLAAALGNLNVVDRIPPGFRYRLGSATLNGVPAEPLVAGRELTWRNQTFAAGERKTWKMILVVGSGVGEGEYTNQAWSLNNLLGSLVSNIAAAVVRVIPDPTFDCSDLIGKVFDDLNANGYQDEGEPGIANVRVVTARGLLVTTDADGRFHVACAAIPQADHGSNFIMKLDERTLPSGYRMTTENPRDVRVTRGKMVKLNFGATVHRVVRLELSPAAFVGENELAPQWQARLPEVVAQLRGRPSVLRIALGGEHAQKRLDAVAARIQALWKKEAEKDKEPIHPLVIETEVEGAR